LSEQRNRIEVNWFKLTSILALAFWVMWLVGYFAWLRGYAQSEIQQHGFKEGIKIAFFSTATWYTWFNLIAAPIFIVVTSLNLRRQRNDPLLSFVVRLPKAENAPRDYERKAYLSFIEAIRHKPSLLGKPLRDVHEWIRQNGVKIDGDEYDLPSFDTWDRYRRGAERFVKANQKAE